MRSGFIVMLALRAVPSMAMQGKGGTMGMGDVYNFDNTQKGNIYAAWGWGYTITQMPGGAVAQLYGAKNTWLWFMSAAGLSSLLIPIGAALGGAGGAIYLVVFLSFVSGLGQGPLYPGKEGLFGSWIPLSEMAFAQGFIGGWWAGGQAFAQLLAPAIMIYMGWEYAFYICKCSSSHCAFFRGLNESAAQSAVSSCSSAGAGRSGLTTRRTTTRNARRRRKP